MYLVFLKPEANNALLGLFPHVAESDVARFFGCKDADFQIRPVGIEVPARPYVTDTATHTTKEQAGTLMIPH